MVATFYHHIHLRTSFLALTPPRRDIGLHSCNAQSRLYLRYMTEAYILESISPPGIGLAQKLAVLPKSGHALIFAHKTKVKHTEKINEFEFCVAFRLSIIHIRNYHVAHFQGFECLCKPAAVWQSCMFGNFFARKTVAPRGQSLHNFDAVLVIDKQRRIKPLKQNLLSKNSLTKKVLPTRLRP